MRPPDTYTCECGTLFNLEDVKDSIVWKDSIGIFNHEPAGAIMSLTHLNEEAQQPRHTRHDRRYTMLIAPQSSTSSWILRR